MNTSFKILIAEDSEVVQMSIHDFLIKDLQHSYSVIKAYNGREACNMAYKHKPDIILIDIEMPVMDGIEAISTIKKNKEIAHIPIIVMSGTRNFKKAMDAGANDFLLKPINQYELLLRLQTNILSSRKDIELKKQQEILANQQFEVIAQRDMILMQQNEMYEDIRYARAIQNAILSEPEILTKFCNSYFIINKPKNIISGDFYWMCTKHDRLYFAVADCTGHGISGALMTIAGNAFLHDILTNYNTCCPSDILNDLRNRVITLLHQKGEIGEMSNGMDIGLCCYNPQTSELHFAGANIPMYIKRGMHTTIEIIKPDRMPVGMHINVDTPFSLQTISIAQGDTIYLFSDGFADQFGGKENKKLHSKGFRNMLLDYSLVAMEKQATYIESFFQSWKGSNEQVDDLLVLGIKF